MGKPLDYKMKHSLLFFITIILIVPYSYAQVVPELRKIEQLWIKEKSVQGLKEVNKFIQKDSTIADAFAFRAIFLRKTGAYPQAKIAAERAIKLDPNSYRAWTELGTLQVMTGKPDSALRYYNKAIQINDHYIPAYSCRGNLNFYYFKKLDDGLNDFNKAIELDKDSDNSFYNRGLLYNEKGDYIKAILDFNRSLALLPKQPKPHFDRGVAYANTGEYKKALKDFKKARKWNSKTDPFERMDEKLFLEWEEYCKKQLKE
jgi:tetratricopeptide (TPR) repeat protein